MTLIRSFLALRPGISLGLFFLASLWAVWPLPWHVRSALPTGDSPTATVPMLNAWIMWWNAESLATGHSDYWNAPIFHPTSGTLAFSEPLPASNLTAPLTWISGSPIAAYNCFLIFAIGFNGYFAARVLRASRCSESIALAGGLGICLHPLALQNLEAVQLVPLGGMLWTVDALIRFQKAPTNWHGFQIGAALATTAFLCLHHALFFLIVIAITGWTCWPSKNWRDGMAGLLTGGVICCAMGLSIVLPINGIHSEHHLKRNPQTVRALSAEPADWLTTQASAWLPLAPNPQGDFPLLPGVLRSTVAIAGLWWSWRRKPKISILLSSICLVSWLLSFGPNLLLGSWCPWQTMCDLLPALGRIRSPYRFAYITQWSLLMLAFIALGEWRREFLVWNLRGKRYPTWLRRLCRTAAGAVVVLLAFEVPPERTFLFHPPLPQHAEPWLTYVADHSKPTDAILCLPLAANLSESAQQQETLWMMYATIHRVPLVNGYSGFLPRHWLALRKQLLSEGIHSRSLDALWRCGTRLLVIRKDKLQTRPIMRQTRAAGALLESIYEDERYCVFRLKAAPESLSP